MISFKKMNGTFYKSFETTLDQLTPFISKLKNMPVFCYKFYEIIHKPHN